MKLENLLFKDLTRRKLLVYSLGKIKKLPTSDDPDAPSPLNPIIFPDPALYPNELELFANREVLRYQQEFDNNIYPLYVQNYEDLMKWRLGRQLANGELLRKYYPLYKTIDNLYEGKIPWWGIWAVHGAESSMSTNPDAFTSNVNYGAMQRAILYHSIEDVNLAAAGFEYLSFFPQERPDDWKEMLWAAKFMYNNMQKRKVKEGITDDLIAFGRAQLDYCVEEAANNRMVFFEYLRSIFN